MSHGREAMRRRVVVVWQAVGAQLSSACAAEAGEGARHQQRSSKGCRGCWLGARARTVVMW